jgi:cell division protein FtsW
MKKTKNQFKTPFFAKGHFDLWFFMFVFLLLTIGLVMMFSASYRYAQQNYDDSLYFIKRQGVFALIGLAIMVFTSKIDYSNFNRRWIAFGLIIASLVMLIAVFAFPAYKGQWHRWIDLKIFQFQPSDVAKFSIVIFLAYWIAVKREKMKTWSHGILPSFIVIGIICGLIIIEPHLSATVLIAIIGLTMIFIGGADWKKLALIGAVAIGLVSIYLFGIKGISYVSERLQGWLDKDFSPQDGRWQINQALYAIGSGGFTGVGIGKSVQKELYVSEPQNDFIFAIVCEEMGFLGAAFIIILFVLLVWRGFKIAMQAPDRFGSMLAMGLTFQVGLQAVLNIAVVTDTIPNTGISLPFFSYGGTALVMLLAQMGVILSISKAGNRQKMLMQAET